MTAVTKADMMTWLTGLVGKGSMPVQQLLGQTGDLSSVNAVYSASGQNVAGIGINPYNNDASQPAIGGYAINTNAPAAAGIQWWNNGGIVLISGLNWPNPSGANGVGPAQSGYVNAADLVTVGSATYIAWHKILDDVAGLIRQLLAAGVVPLLSPLHEANLNGSWWWDLSGLTDAQYVWLWQDMWNYYTNTLGLTNLIWIYAENGGNHRPARYPGDAYVDITGCDDYTTTPASDVGAIISQQGYHNKPQGWCEWGSGLNWQSTSNTVIVNALRNTSLIYWEQWSVDWAISNNPDVSAAMNDPWVLPLAKLGRPGTGTVSTPTQGTTTVAASANNTVIKPGSGTITDAAGNTYTIAAANDTAEVNGVALTGGGGTGSAEYYNGVVYWQDGSSGNWYTYANGTWTAAAAPPSSTPVTTPITSSAPTAAQLSAITTALQNVITLVNAL